jgi:hypothetical protein
MVNADGCFVLVVRKKVAWIHSGVIPLQIGIVPSPAICSIMAAMFQYHSFDCPALSPFGNRCSRIYSLAGNGAALLVMGMAVNAACAPRFSSPENFGLKN